LPSENRPPKNDREKGDGDGFGADGVVLAVVVDEELVSETSFGLGDLEIDLDAGGVKSDPGDGDEAEEQLLLLFVVNGL
jgi:hypothetical protein